MATKTVGGDKRIALVTGSDKGLGLEFCRQLLQKGCIVVATARDPASATDLSRLREQYQDDLIIQGLDQTNEDQVQNLAKTLQERGYYLDLLLLNAGAAEEQHPYVNPSEMDMNELRRLLDVNVVGTAAVMKYMMPMVKVSKEKKVVCVSTKMASLEATMGDKPYLSAPYRISKAAENMLCRVWARDPTAKEVTVLAIHPGHAKTEMGEAGGREAPLPVEDSVKMTLETICAAGPEKTGSFLNYDGTPLPW